MKDGFETDSGWPKLRVRAAAHTVSRRQVLRLAAGIGLSASLAPLLAACGGDDDDDDEDGDSGASVTQTSGTEEPATEASGTRELEDMLGPVTVPAKPERVIAGNTALGNMLALGVKPIGTDINVNSVPHYLADQMEGIVEVTGETGIDIEKALSLNPDLMIAISGSAGELWNREDCERYKEFVTTFCYDQSYVYEEDIKNNVVQVAHALGIEERADEVLAEFDARVADLKQKVIDAGFDDKPVTVVRIFQDGNYSIRIGTSESIIFRAVGIPQPPGQQEPEDFSIDLSLERLDVLNEAYAVVVYIDDNSSVTESDILNNEVWQSLTPVQEDRVVFVSSGVWNSIDIQGAHAIMDDVENLILPLAQQGSTDPANTKSDEPASPTAEDATSEPAAETGTREFEHAFGVATIPTAPQRVVALTPYAFDAAIDVGVIPVASVSNVGSLLEGRLADVETVLDPSEPDLEAVIAADPDLVLILASEGEPLPARALELESIAPVVAFDFESSAQWKEIFLFFADALNKADEGTQILAEYDARVAELRESFGGQVETTEVRVVRVSAGEGVRIYLRDSFPGTVLDDVGFARPEGEPAEGFAVDLSLERLGEIDADHIFVWSFSATPEGAEDNQEYFENEILDTPLWEQLGAVSEDYVYIVGDYWIGAGVAQATQMLEDLFTHLVDGGA